MGYRLRDDLSFGIVNDRAYFLDVSEDRYFTLPADLNTAFRAAMTDRDASLSDSLRPLLHRGLLVAQPLPTNLAQPDIEELADSFIDDDDGRARLFSVFHALAVQAATAMDLRSKPLSQIVADLRSRRRASTRLAHPGRAKSILRAFRDSALLFSANDRCLLKSLSLARALIEAGEPAWLVFGVRDSPFSAHCWVQRGRTVLNDSFDSASTYRPVLAA